MFTASARAAFTQWIYKLFVRLIPIVKYVRLPVTAVFSSQIFGYFLPSHIPSPTLILNYKCPFLLCLSYPMFLLSLTASVSDVRLICYKHLTILYLICLCVIPLNLPGISILCSNNMFQLVVNIPEGKKYRRLITLYSGGGSEI